MTTMKTWIITDTHFNHASMVKLCGRPENHTEIICDNIRKMVKPEDIVIHLGDVIWSRPGSLGEIMASLPGRWILVRGNHDHHHSDAWFMEKGFSMVVNGLELAGIYFSHKPVATIPPGCVKNVHGHFHNSKHHNFDCPTYPHSQLFEIETNGLKPVLLETFIMKDKNDAPVEKSGLPEQTKQQ